MKNTIKVVSIVFVAIFVFTAATCFGQSGGRTINSAEDLKKYLDSQPANGPNNPIRVTMAANAPMLPQIAKAINSAGKYVSLTLTGNALTTIPGFAFSDGENPGCDMLVSVTIPSSVTTIKDNAFDSCNSLASVTIPNSVTSIGGWLFNYGGDSLTSVTIPASVTSIGKMAFMDCTSLTSVTFQGTITADNLGDSPFRGDLRDKYLAGGIGTYKTTTPVPSNRWAWNPVWTKTN